MLALLLGGVIAVEPVSFESRVVPVANKRIKAGIVRVRLAEVRIQIGLAHDRVGTTELLAELARRKGALAAINGSFFDAYVDRPEKSPHHTVITGGQVVHLGNVGSLFAIKRDGTAAIGRLELGIVGSREGSESWPNKWFAYWINRFPTAATVTIFTRHYGVSTGLSGGRQIVVERGEVREIGPGPMAIPADGFVVYISGVRDSSFDRIAVGSKLGYRVVPKNGGWGPFGNAQEAVGAGPTLVRDGQIALDPSSEGFQSEKILTGGGARSLVGVTAGGELLLVASAGTMADMAGLMKGLGCRDAMNLDGGASSGLIFKGRAVRPPGRPISNAILVMKKG